MLFGDSRETLKTLPAGSVQMCVTSPPYFGLRSYLPESHPYKHLEIGLEKTPEEFIASLVQVFREVRRVLAADGTCWVNIGDSYASGGGLSQPDRAHSGDLRTVRGGQGSASSRGGVDRPKTAGVGGIKPKDLIGIPWRLAFALQADGWWLRQDIVWAKPNPMPESVTDRCTKSHEYIFLLSKSQRYYFDHEAIKEPAIGGEPGNVTHKGKTAYEQGDVRMRTKAGLTNIGAAEKRNKRSVWEVATQPYPGSHFAVFPPTLIEPCILAGSKPGDTVLDPFFGSGTVGEACEALGRDWIGCDLNDGYQPLQMERTAQMGLVLG